MKVVIFDSTENGIKEWFWRRYMQARVGWRKFGASSWDDAAEAIGAAYRGAVMKLKPQHRAAFRLSEVQIWGDGASGLPMIAGKPMSEAFIRRIQVSVGPESLVWFRMCSVLFGGKGQAFAERTAKELGCRIAGHTHTIGVLQSGLYSLGPGESPHVSTWGPRDEVLAGDWTKLESGWREPRTIFCARMSLPVGW